MRKGWHLHTHFLLDTKPVPVMGYKRSKKHSDFAGSADYRRCVSRNLKYFGYKLVTVCTLHGLPFVYELVSANTDERLAAETVMDYFSFCDFFGNKGFLGWKWQTQILDQTNNLIWTPRRVNQHYKTLETLIVGFAVFANVSKASFMKYRILAAILNACWQKPCWACVPGLFLR